MRGKYLQASQRSQLRRRLPKPSPVMPQNHEPRWREKLSGLAVDVKLMVKRQSRWEGSFTHPPAPCRTACRDLARGLHGVMRACR
uniref:Uncharacterized protein n=1 Tax=Arundo donax TaxID=35708 RepID=A0A0A9CSB0_ARUDO